MKILKIERIIRNLLDRGTCKGLSTYFELKNKNNSAQNDDGVSPFAHTRNGEFESQPGVRYRGQPPLQKHDLL